MEKIIRKRLAELKEIKRKEFKRFITLEGNAKEESFIEQDRLHQRINELENILKLKKMEQLKEGTYLLPNGEFIDVTKNESGNFIDENNYEISREELVRYRFIY